MSSRVRGKDKIHYVASTTFTIDRKYSDLKLVGKGSYGVVCSALDTSNDSKIAIKKITPMAKDIMDAKHVLREIRLMRHMGKHENVISLKDIMVRESADELYIVMELLDSDLHRVIQSPQILTASHHRHFIHQLLCGVKYLHDNRIIHRDLKPGNLLVTRDCKLRITDFGLARERPTGHGADPDDDIDEPMTEHVVTRWYRPPELMLCPDGLYTYAVDMWSVGCILAEMMARRPIFPGKNFIDQLTLIFDVIGSPQPDEVAHIQNSQAKKYLSSQKGKRSIPAERIFPEASGDFHEILNGLLVFDPSKRMTVDECLRAPLFANVAPSVSTVYPPVSSAFEFSFERNKSTKDKLKQLIVAECTSIHRENLAQKRLSKSRPGDALAGVWEEGSDHRGKMSTSRSRRDLDGDDDDKSRTSHTSSSTAGRTADTGRTDATTKPSQRQSQVPRYATSTGQPRGYAQPRHPSTGRERRDSSARSTSTGRTGVDRDSGTSRIKANSRSGLGSTAGSGSESQIKTASNMRDTKQAPIPPRAPAVRSDINVAKEQSGVAARDTEVYASPARNKSDKNADMGTMRTSSPMTAMDSPSRRNTGAMRELEDAECSQRAMQYLSKMSGLAPTGANASGAPRPPSKSPRRTEREPVRTALPVDADEDEDDLIARMSRLYGVNMHEGRHEAVPVSKPPEDRGNIIRSIARRTESTPDSPPLVPAAHATRRMAIPDDDMDDDDVDEADLRAARRLLASSTRVNSSSGVEGLAAGKDSPSRESSLRNTSIGRKDPDRRNAADVHSTSSQAKDVQEGLQASSVAQAKSVERAYGALGSKETKANSSSGNGAAVAVEGGAYSRSAGDEIYSRRKYPQVVEDTTNYGSDGDDSNESEEEEEDREAEAKVKAARGGLRRGSHGSEHSGGNIRQHASTTATAPTRRRDLEDKPWRVNSTLAYRDDERTQRRQRDAEAQGMDAVAAVRNMYMLDGKKGRDLGDTDLNDDEADERDHKRRAGDEVRSKRAHQSSAIPAKKNITVPKSPQFSKMSWQRRGQGRPDAPPPAIPPSTAHQQHMRKKKSEENLHTTTRHSSAPRGKKLSTDHGGSLNKTHSSTARDKRSVSSGRLGGTAGRGGLY